MMHLNPRKRLKGIKSILHVIIAIGVLAVADTTAEPPQPATSIAAVVHQLLSSGKLGRLAAYHTLYTQTTAADISALVQVLERAPRDESRWRAARLIGNLSDDQAITPLTDALRRDKSNWVRWAAARALEDIGSPRAAEPLRSAMESDVDSHVRKRSAAALCAVSPSAGLDSIRKARTAEKNHGVLLTYRWLLERHRHQGTKVPPIVPGHITEGWHAGTRYKIYVPKHYRRGAAPSELLVAVHGTDSVGDLYLDIGQQDADRRGYVILTPWFDYPTFFNFDNMNLGATGLGKNRTDQRLLDIIADLDGVMSLDSDRFRLYGQSRGGQFVQRFVLSHPERIARAAACGSGSYVHPDDGQFFPFGIAPNPFAPDLFPLNYADLLKTPLAIVVGSLESPERLSQAGRFMKSVHRYAAQQEMTHRVEYLEVSGGKHSGKTNFPVATKFLFGEDGAAHP